MGLVASLLRNLMIERMFGERLLKLHQHNENNQSDVPFSSVKEYHFITLTASVHPFISKELANVLSCASGGQL